MLVQGGINLLNLLLLATAHHHGPHPTKLVLDHLHMNRKHFITFTVQLVLGKNNSKCLHDFAVHKSHVQLIN
jgi:hypothetical protein